MTYHSIGTKLVTYPLTHRITNHYYNNERIWEYNMFYVKDGNEHIVRSYTGTSYQEARGFMEHFKGTTHFTYITHDD